MISKMKMSQNEILKFAVLAVLFASQTTLAAGDFLMAANGDMAIRMRTQGRKAEQPEIIRCEKLIKPKKGHYFGVKFKNDLKVTSQPGGGEQVMEAFRGEEDDLDARLPVCQFTRDGETWLAYYPKFSVLGQGDMLNFVKQSDVHILGGDQPNAVPAAASAVITSSTQGGQK